MKRRALTRSESKPHKQFEERSSAQPSRPHRRQQRGRENKVSKEKKNTTRPEFQSKNEERYISNATVRSRDVRRGISILAEPGTPVN